MKNLIAEPRVTIRVGGVRELRPDVEGTRSARANVVTDPAADALARRLLDAKYHGRREGQDLSEWAREALVIAVRYSG